VPVLLLLLILGGLRSSLVNLDEAQTMVGVIQVEIESDSAPKPLSCNDAIVIAATSLLQVPFKSHDIQGINQQV